MSRLKMPATFPIIYSSSYFSFSSTETNIKKKKGEKIEKTRLCDQRFTVIN